MKKIGGLWIPDNEDYLAEKLEGIPNYVENYDRAFIARACTIPNRRIALDVGAHVGLWSRHLARHFEYVHAFEPLAQARECWHMNMDKALPASLWDCALGDREGNVGLHHGHSGRFTTFKTFVKGGGDVRMMRLDHWAENELRPDTHIDFIKIDCEGFDLYVLHGAEQTIRKHKPVIMFEDKKGVSLKRYRLQQYMPLYWLKDRGYTMAHFDNGNFFMEPTAWPSLAL